jgi:hypothetical protein
MFKLKKWFMIFKNRNHFMKTKVSFSVKLKIVSVALNTLNYGNCFFKYHFRPKQRQYDLIKTKGEENGDAACYIVGL